MTRFVRTFLALLMLVLGMAFACAEQIAWEPGRWPMVLLCFWLGWLVSTSPGD